MATRGIGRCPFAELESQELLFKEMRDFKNNRKGFLNPKGETVFYYLASKLIEANKHSNSPVRFCFHCYSFKTRDQQYTQKKDNESMYISVSLNKIFTGNELEETMYATRWTAWLAAHKSYFLHIGAIRIVDKDTMKILFRLPFFGRCARKHKESITDKFLPFAKDLNLPDPKDLTFTSMLASSMYSYRGAYGPSNPYNTPYPYSTKSSTLHSPSLYAYYDAGLYGSSGVQSNSASDWSSLYAQSAPQQGSAQSQFYATGISSGNTATGSSSTSSMLQTLQSLTSTIHLGTSFPNSQSSTPATTGPTSMTPPIPSSSLPTTQQSPLRLSNPYTSLQQAQTTQIAHLSQTLPSPSTLHAQTSQNTQHTPSVAVNLPSISALEALQLKWREGESKRGENADAAAKGAGATADPGNSGASSGTKKKKKKKDESRESKDTIAAKDGPKEDGTGGSNSRNPKEPKEPKEARDLRESTKDTNTKAMSVEHKVPREQLDEEEEDDRSKSKKKRRSEREQQKGEDRERERERKDRKRRRKERESSDEQTTNPNEAEDS